MRVHDVRRSDTTLSGVVGDFELWFRVDGAEQLLPVDHVVVCAGQEPRRTLFDALDATAQEIHVIGGADVAAELDAKRAIAQGTALAAKL